MSNKVFVGGLSWNTSEADLQDLFSQVGEITEVKLITDRETGRSRGFGFVTYHEPSDANQAIEKFDGTEFDGRTIKVNLAEDRKRSNSSHRGGGGGGGNRGGGFRNNNRW